MKSNAATDILFRFIKWVLVLAFKAFLLVLSWTLDLAGTLCLKLSEGIQKGINKAS